VTGPAITNVNRRMRWRRVVNRTYCLDRAGTGIGAAVARIATYDCGINQ